MTRRDRRLRRERVLRTLGLGLLLLAFALPEHLGWPWSALNGRERGATAAAAWEEIARALRRVSGDAGLLWAAPLALLPGWILATARPPASAGGRRLLRGWFVAGAGVIVVAGVTQPLFAAAGAGWTRATNLAAVAWLAAAVVAAFPPRRRLRLDPAPWAAAQAAACALPWTLFVLETALTARFVEPFQSYAMRRDDFGLLPLLEDSNVRFSTTIEPGFWDLPWHAVPGTFLLWTGLLLFALPSYLSRRRRPAPGATGSPALASPAAP